MELDIFYIRSLPIIYEWDTDPVDCTYHSDPTSGNSLKIFIERNIPCEAQWLYCYELAQKNKFFILKTFEENDCDADFAGTEKDKVVNFVVEKIIKDTMLGLGWEQEHPEKKERHHAEKNELREILEDLIGKFIG